MNEFYAMSHNMQQYQQMIASYTGKLLRDHFGKGPESVQASIGSNYVVLYFRNFITPSERVLLDQDQSDIVENIRERLLQSLLPELGAYIEVVTGGVRPKQFYYDWSLHNKTGMLVGISEEPFPGAGGVDELYAGKQAVEQEIALISEQAQKLPESMFSLALGNRMILVIRDGILVRIEKELIRLGYETLLKQVKRNLEKSFMHNNTILETALGRHVIDFFVDWDVEMDRSVMLIVTNG